MIVNRFLWSFVVKNVSCRKYVPSKICPILLLVENMSTLLLVENMSVDNMSVENMSIEKTTRCPCSWFHCKTTPWGTWHFTTERRKLYIGRGFAKRPWGTSVGEQVYSTRRMMKLNKLIMPFFNLRQSLPIIVNIRSFHISITIKMQNISRKNEDLLLGIQTVDCRMVDADKSTSHVAIFFNGVIGYHITKL